MLFRPTISIEVDFFDLEQTSSMIIPSNILGSERRNSEPRYPPYREDRLHGVNSRD